MEEILSLQGVSKSYGSRLVLDDVTFTLERGQKLMLLGPNGAGKTTLCNLLAGLVPQDRGKIHLWGMSYGSRATNEKILQKMGLLMQETRLYGRFTVKETLELFQSFYEETRTVEDVLSMVNLESQKDTSLEHLSGGQRKRAYLGCALIHKPDLLLLDEPTGALDPGARRDLWAILESESARGACLIIATHDLYEAECHGDLMAIIHQGRLVAYGSLEELKASEGWKLEVLGDNHQAYLEVLGDPWKISGRKMEFEAESFEEAFRKFSNLGNISKTLESFSLRRGNLEDVFFHRTGREFKT